MGREQLWTKENFEDWAALRNKPAFKSLVRIAAKGLARVEPSDIKDLVDESPVLSSHENVTAARQGIRDAIARVEPTSRRLALEALMRASPVSENMTSERSYQLARVHLGEADASLASLARELGKAEADLSPLEKMRQITGSNDSFRRTPKPTHRPGERMYLLRDLYDQLFPVEENEAPVAAVIDQPIDNVTYRSGQSDLESVRNILERQYNTTLELTRFASVVIDDHRAIEHLVMDVELRDCDDEYFWFDVKRDFSGRLDRYFVGVAAGHDAHRTVMRHVPELRELIWLPPKTDLEDEVEKLVSNGMLMVRDTSAASGYRAAAFNEVPEDDPVVQRLAKDGLSRQDYRLLEADRLNPSELLQYRSALCMRLRRERRRCTWFADGPTYVNKVRIAVRNFGDAFKSPHLSVAYFLPGSDLRHGPDHFERDVQSWVVRHHGFTIAW